MAADAKAAGQYDKADAFYREAKEMEQRLTNIAKPKKGVGQENRLERQVEQLRDQVNGLRKEIEELKEIVRNRATER
jgi:TolA-binding protein